MPQTKRGKFFKWISACSKKYWIATVLIVKLSAVWYSLFLTFLGESCSLITQSEQHGKQLTGFGWLLTILVFLCGIVLALADRYEELYDEKQIEYDNVCYEKDLFRTINRSVNNICQKKTNKQLDALRDFRLDKKTIPEIYTSPCNQIEIILEEVNKCICFLLTERNSRFDEDDFSVSLIYNFYLENPDVWKWANNVSSVSLPESEIVNPKSTFQYLLNKKTKNFVFYNRKQKAYEEEHYIISQDDIQKDGKLQGSIGCFYFDFKDNQHTYIRAVLSISTFQKSFFQETEFATEQDLKKAEDNLATNIMNYIVKNYQYRIGVELCNYYVQYLAEQQNK